MFDLVIFDFDGLILDTETPEYDAWQEIYGEFGVSMSLEVWGESIGQRAGTFDPLAHLEVTAGCEIPRLEIKERHQLRFHNLLQKEALRPGITSYLDDADRLGVKLAVASSATRDWVEGHLVRHNIAHRFGCIVTVEDVTHAKPDPELFNLALTRMNARADRAVVLEDSPNGLLAANRAGIFAVAVPNPVTAGLALGHADLTISSLADWPMERLRDAIVNHRSANSRS